MNAAEHLLGAAALARHASRIAFICGEDSITYAQFAAQVAQAAEALRGLGVAPGDRVLLLMRDTPEYAAAWLGAVRIGAVAIGLNNKLPDGDYHHIRTDSGARLAIVEDIFALARPDLSAGLSREGALAVAGSAPFAGAQDWRRLVQAARSDGAPFEADADHPAFWLYSSGTTGRPKGIVHTHRSILPAGQVQREILGLAAGDRVLATSKLFFAYALETSFLGPLSFGGTAILNPDWAELAPISALVARHRPAALFSVPSFYRRLLSLPRDALAPYRDVRRFMSAGERLPASVADAWRDATGREIQTAYGMSETFCVCLATPPGETGPTRTGVPLSGVDVQLRTSEGAAPAPGTPGVLWVRHPALALEYANRPEATREQFVDGWFCTRDVFVRDAAGHFVHQGRSDEFMKVAGQWVQPGEIEEVLADVPEIVEAACVPVQDENGFERLALFVVPRGSTEGALAAATRVCEAQLARHKRPKWIRGVVELPRTATGKMQRFKLREMLQQELGSGG